MELIPVNVDELPAGRTGDTVTLNFLQQFLDANIEGAQVMLHEGEKVDGSRARLQAAIHKNDLPIRVISETIKGEGGSKEVRLFVKRDENVLAEIAKRKSDQKAAAERAKAERAAAKAAKAQGTDTAEVANVETTEVVETVDADAPKSGKRGR